MKINDYYSGKTLTIEFIDNGILISGTYGSQISFKKVLKDTDELKEFLERNFGDEDYD